MSIAAYQGVCPTCRYDHSADTPAPTTREIADHAELVAMKPDDILAILRADRLPECSFDNGMTWVTDDVIVAETFARAADALENLMSEIAALRGERDRWHSAYEIAHDQATANGSAARQAERQRDEAVGLLRELADGRSQKNNINEYDDLSVRPSTVLANQGADQ